MVRAVAEVEDAQGGWLTQLRDGLSKSRKALQQQFSAVLFDRFNEDLWERIEEALIYADVGVETTISIVGSLEAEANAGTIKDAKGLLAKLREITANHFCQADTRIDVAHSPAVILMVGVNGTGKTTTIGKIAWHLKELGKEPLLVAGDTFRAAAIEQLTEWGRRVGCEVVRHERGGDPGAVVYDGLEAAQARKADVVIIDTAGRLHTQVNLMKELEKVRRVIDKRIPGAPHECLLTIDATTGQNGLIQARMFKEAVNLSGVVITKMDGTAKGGIALAVSHELDLPIKLIGTGEKLESLQPFDPADFAALLFDDSLGHRV
ncbi:MAG: signal recognition particle-docking protein FtsY [Actinobacteria bacterium RBG_16_64_13]|nr:MAG: signal recognition particle-docking protein FtsY [Actinobacteria bacterium RBG_16_64_13]